MKERKVVYTCDYDGIDTSTVLGTGDALPTGWSTKTTEDGVGYYHSDAHAILGGTSGGKVISYVFTDDTDLTVVEQASDDLPPGWVAFGTGDNMFTFKDQASFESWFTT